MSNIVAKRKSTGEVLVACLLRQDVDSTLQSYNPPLDMTDVEILEGVSNIDLKTLVKEHHHSTLTYAEKRKAEYDQLNQYEMMFDDQRDGTTTWVDKINEIKSRYPK